MAAMMAIPMGLPAANHREAPITGPDHKADITDVFAFVSYSADQAANQSRRRSLLLSALIHCSSRPTGHYFPFDTSILYEIKIDNNHDAQEDVIFQFQFDTEQRLPGLWQPSRALALPLPRHRTHRRR
jgi:hypothetical protein